VKSTIWTGTLTGMIGIATAAALLAQTTAPPQAQAPSADDVVVTGCLRAAPPNSAGTAGTAGATTPGATGTAGAAAATPGAAPTTGTAEQTFMLMDASRGSNASATPSPADAAAPASSKQTYRLIANPAALAEHVGKKLELTGTIDAGQAANTTSADATQPVLRVKSGKIVAPSCDEK
jgi:hypothetical protein